MICNCGQNMHRHGSRRSPMVDYEDNAFVASEASVTRFLCPHCGSTSSLETPEGEKGFRLSVRAADAILETALSGGIAEAAALASIDRSSVSRLLASRADAYLASNVRPNVSCVGAVGGGVHVWDAETGSVAACFDKVDDHRLVNWLSSPSPALVLPDPEVAPRVLGWSNNLRVALTKPTYLSLLVTPLRRAARKMAAVIVGGATKGVERIAELLVAPQTGLRIDQAMELSRIASNGMPARHFLRLRDRICGICDVVDLENGRQRLAAVIEDCQGAWADIFAPVLDFLSAYREVILTYSVALLTPAPVQRLQMAGPANLLTLAAARGLLHKPELTRSLKSSPRLSYLR